MSSDPQRPRLPERAYQLIVVALLALVAVLAWPREESGAAPAAGQAPTTASAPANAPTTPPSDVPPVKIVRLPDLVAKMAAENPDAPDRSETLYSSPFASAHVHLIGKGQLCPLHLHRESSEATVILTGTPEVRTVCARGGQPERAAQRVAPGTVLGAPPLCAHEWSNATSAEPQANLVLAFPPFDGNLYVRDDDPRALQGGPPFAWRADEELARFAAGAAEVEQAELPVLAGRLSRIFLKGRTTLPVKPDTHSVLYVLAGKGTVDQSGARPVDAGTAVVLTRRKEVRLSATEPMALLVFEPPTR